MNNKDLNFIGSIDKGTTIEDLKKFYKFGLTNIRLNMSYRLEYYEEAVKTIQFANSTYGINIKLICDLAGTEMRVTNSEPFPIKIGQKVIIGKDITFDQGDLSILEPQDEIMINDGEIILSVENYSDGFLYCTSKSENTINPNANAYNRKIYQTLPFISDKDKKNLTDAVRYQADYIAVSHVRNKDDLTQIKQFLKTLNSNIALISKIENEEAIENLDEIIEASDGIMIARGDLGKILPIEELGYNQKIITDKTLKSGKFLISATEYLGSLINSKTPTRADVIDLFSAYEDGIKNIMFSKELILSIDKENYIQIAHKIYNSYLKYENYKTSQIK